jgi:hypothetical protein
LREESIEHNYSSVVISSNVYGTNCVESVPKKECHVLLNDGRYVEVFSTLEEIDHLKQRISVLESKIAALEKQ